MSVDPHPVLESIHEIHARAGQRFSTGELTADHASSSPLHRRAIFLLGSPRSGTTWLQQLLATHPDVATSGESHVFCEGVDALFRNRADPDPTIRISTWVDDATLTRLVRALVDGVFESMRSTLRPTATRVLDKTPNHIPYAASLARVYPDAAFVHLIRDGRDVAASAHGFWGVNDAWRTAGHAARTWRTAVLDNRAHLGALRYHEVRYEELVGDTARCFAGILDAIELDHGPDYLKAAVAFCRSPVNIRPSGGPVGVRKWRSMNRDVEREIVTAAGDLLVELGYLTENERRAIRRRRSPRTLAHIGRRRAGLLARRARNGARSFRRARRLAQRRVVQGTATALAELVEHGADHGPKLFHPSVVLEEKGRPSCSGPTEVAARLTELAGGARVLRVDADEEAGALYLLDRSGAPRLLSCRVTAGRVDQITVQDG